MRRFLPLLVAAWLLPGVVFAQEPEAPRAAPGVQILPSYNPLIAGTNAVRPVVFALASAAALEVVGVPQQQVMVQASVDETPGRAVFVLGCRETVFLVVWNTGVTSGAIVFETAESENAPGTWAVEATATFEGTAPIRTVVQITGAHFWIRPRVETVIANGNADVWVGCN